MTLAAMNSRENSVTRVSFAECLVDWPTSNTPSPDVSPHHHSQLTTHIEPPFTLTLTPYQPSTTI